ncbi:Sorting nexin-13 [Thelohanellus kitauei]|uniref:Sorting nexin-13 n=1 Tax=Thelohanellus kitauei TaxID=669202 RepID=A0A0C2MCC6_THEKT|nr:Sorting nexin-13 [Thelohanellus kitauei]
MNTGLPGVTYFVKNRKSTMPSYNPTGIEQLDQVIEHISYLFMRDFVLEWHDQYFNDKVFTSSIMLNFNVLISYMCCKIKNVKWSYFCAIKLNRIFANHVKIYIKALSTLNERELICQSHTKIISEFFELETSTDKKISHKNVCTDVNKEIEFLTFLVESFLYLLLPEQHFNDKVLRFFIRDVVVTQLFLPLINSICDPDFINRGIHTYHTHTNYNNESFINAIRITFSHRDLHELITAIQFEITKLSGNDMNDKGIWFITFDSDDGIKKQILSLMFVKSLCSNQLENLKRNKYRNQNPNFGQNDESPLLDINSNPINIQVSDRSKEIPFKDLLENNVSFPYLADYFQEIGEDHLIFLYFGIKDLLDNFDQSPTSDHNSRKSSNTSDDQITLLRLEIFNMIHTSQKQFDNKPIKFDHRPHFSNIIQEASKPIPVLNALKHLQASVNISFENDFSLLPRTIVLKSILLISKIPKVYSASLVLADLFQKDFAIDVNIADHEITVQYSTKFISYIINVIIVSHNVQYSWNIMRRYRDFLQFHHNLVSKFPFVANIFFPTSKLTGAKLEDIIEKRKKALGDYLKALINHENFKSNKQFYQIISNFIDKNIHVYWKNQDAALQSESIDSSQRIYPTETDQDYIKLSYMNLDREEIETRAMSILVNLMEEMFDLRTKTPWLARQLKTFIKEVYIAATGDRVIRQIIDDIDDYLSATKMVEYLTYFREQFWPGNVWCGFSAPRSESLKSRERLIASSILIGIIPTELRRFLGEEVVLDGVRKLFNMLQISQLNKRLFYVVLESIIETIFPDNSYPEIIKTLAES